MDGSDFNEKNCVICKEGFQNSDPIVVTKGIANLVKFSSLHGDTALEEHLLKQNSTTPPGTVVVHKDCR